MSENSELHEPSESVLEPEPQRPAMIRSEEVLK
ncbi:MAG: hypothetical protein JWQ19_4026, partial [Subtercola sp.]|nr:hypothetical protein [Subtercola sp.]